MNLDMQHCNWWRSAAQTTAASTPSCLNVTSIYAVCLPATDWRSLQHAAKHHTDAAKLLEQHVQLEYRGLSTKG